MAISFVTNFIAFVIVLGFLIFFHEAGHFLFAKLFKVRVLVFSFGFGKRLLGFKRRDTDYRVSLIPLGGYVRMAGDNPEEVQEGAADEFLSRPKWQRFLILLAGPGANVIIAILFLAVLFMAGVETLRIEPVIGAILPNKPAERAGLQAGDRIIEANGEPINSFEELRLAIAINPETPVTIKYLRNGQEGTTTVTPERITTDYGTTGQAGFQSFIEPVVGRVSPGGAAQKAGLQPGDRIVEANGQKVTQLGDLEQPFTTDAQNPVSLTVLREGRQVSLTLPANKPPSETYPGFVTLTVMRKFGLIGALKESVSQNWRMVKYTFHVLGRLFRAKGSVKDFTGPINIARMAGEMLRTGWKEVLGLMAAISLQLGIMNLLPIPVLDGGHILILGVEGLMRRELSIRAKERIQQVGFAVLALLMIVVIYNDVLHNVNILRRG